MSKTYSAVFKVVTPKATRVIDRFHVMRHAILAVDQTRRRVQQQRLGHRGRPATRSTGPASSWSSRPPPPIPSSRHVSRAFGLGRSRRRGGLRLQRQRGRRAFYETEDPEQPPTSCATSSTSAPSVRRHPKCAPGAHPANWFEPIVAWHQAKVSNGPTEGMNNLLKRVKRVAFGFTNFENFRIRALLYAGKPNFRVLDSIVVT